MPYDSLDDLPRGVISSLPKQGQHIYQEAFNSAWDTYEGQRKSDREETSHRVAWSAVKKKYERSGSGVWHKKR